MYSLIVFLPLMGCLVAGLGGRWIKARGAGVLTSSLIGVCAIMSWIAFIHIGLGHGTAKVHLLSWIHSGRLHVDWALRIDTLSAVMLVVVNTVSALVHIYSIGYMAHDSHQPRFFAYLSLFTFAMLMLVTADNLAQMFFGWEGVGLASYLLIGFWYKRPSANAAAMKAFIVNRVGDFGFSLGIFAIFTVFGAVDFDTIFTGAPDMVGKTMVFLGRDMNILTTICLLLFMGSMGKSAQFLLHTWLPDAMEGPTPVSALIHAATMVTAGVFLIARMSPLYDLAPDALFVVTLVGATTAFFAATIALVQNDIKRVIAYSTCSQLGYMFAALGVGAYGVAIFHLFTHAFFKALLFLGSGSVIHAMSDEQDMRKMGGLFTHLKKTWAMMLVGTLALTGFPLTAGYFSKDAIIEATAASGNAVGQYALWMTVIAAFLTSFYSWRLMFMTFHGRSRASKTAMTHLHESPNIMLTPLYVLAVGALAAGAMFADLFIGRDEAAFWGAALFRGDRNHVMAAMHHVSWQVSALPSIMMIAGFALAWLFYIARPDIPRQLALRHEPLYRFLLNKWYFDELYDMIFVRGVKTIGRFLWKYGDGWAIDGFGPDGVSARVIDIANRVVRLQTGYLYHYAFAMMIGIAALISWFMFASL
ncbi:MAG: NADH-quinone oxidoreductase subunit L [Hyphomicrobiales bacterium]